MVQGLSPTQCPQKHLFLKLHENSQVYDLDGEDGEHLSVGDLAVC
jgi:hypothetical protein